MGSLKRRRAACWIALLGGAALWRLLCFTGPLGSDDLAYSENARAIAAGAWSPQPDIFALRLGYTGPLALFYALFGAGPATLALPNLLASLAEAALCRKLARRFLGDGASWLAAALVAVLPLHVHFASEAHPDVPVAALGSAAVLLFFRRRPFAAGACLGAAHFMKESAFFGLAALAVFGWRSRRGDLLRALAAFLAFVALEAVAYALATGDPLYRLHAVASRQAEAMGSAFYQEAVPTFRRVLLDIPSMLFLPWSGGWPFFVFLPLAALGGAWRNRRLSLVAWPAVLLLLLTFWPISLAPYRPAMVAHPRIFLILSVPMAILAARGLLSLPRPAAVAAAFLLVPSSLAAAVALAEDARRFSEGARLAWPAVEKDVVVVSDPRTTGLFRLYDGYRAPGRWIAWTEERPLGPHLLVVNETWTSTLEGWYGVRRPAWVREPAGELILDVRISGRRSLRTLLSGRVGTAAGPSLQVWRRRF